MSDYTYEDISRLPLPEGIGRIFCDRLRTRYDKDYVAGSLFTSHGAFFEYDFANVQSTMAYVARYSYRDSLAYVMAQTNVERAKAAYGGPSTEHKKEVLNIWLDCIKDMSTLEKTLEGWGKL